MNRRVAIFQNTLTGGGRIKVVNEIVRVLNEFDIVPDIFTLRINPSFKKEENLNFNIKKRPQLIRGFYELKIISLNVLMRFVEKNYDLFINSNNSLLFTPSHIKTITYIHFPREARIDSRYASLAFPDGKLVSEKGIFFSIGRRSIKMLYRYRRCSPNNFIIANSQFTKTMFLKAYPAVNPDGIEVIYPPVAIDTWKNDNQEKKNIVTTLGRFSSDKRQLEQIQIAEKLRDIPFNIVGFVGNKESRAYFQRCERYIKSNNISNVFLRPNLSPQEARKLLQESRYFMHSLRNEPFGISTVESIAAGCVPIVHNSGGQREIVPFEELRFNSLTEAVDKIKKLGSKELTPTAKELQNQIWHYDMIEFRNKMKIHLVEMLSV